MSVNQIFSTLVIVFVLLSGGIGYWIYDLYETINLSEADAKVKNAQLERSKAKVRKVTSLEDKKSKLEVRRNQVSVQVPLEGSQSAIDIMAIIDDLKQHVETDNVAFPLLITEHGVVSGIEEEKVVKSRGRLKKKKDYKTVTIRLSVRSTWLGLLRFIDLLEGNEQIFNVTSITGAKLKEEQVKNNEVSSVASLEKQSPLKYPFYSNSELTIEAYHFSKEKKKAKR